MHHGCPHHGEALVRNHIESADAWRCENCDGLWLPGAIVEHLVGPAPRWPSPAGIPPCALRCPDDGHPLQMVEAEGIELDLCMHCHDVWLDRGELAQILRREREDDAWDEDTVERIVDSAETALDCALDTPRPRAAVVRKDEIDVMPSKPLPASAGSGPSMTQTDAMRLATLESGAPAGTSAPLHGGADIAAAADGGMIDGAVELAGEALGAVLSFIGDVFSAF